MGRSRKPPEGTVPAALATLGVILLGAACAITAATIWVPL